MFIKPFFLSVSSLLALSGLAPAEASHRVLIVDVGDANGAPKTDLVLLDLETGKVIAKASLGKLPEVGVSAKGDLAAVVTFNGKASKYTPQCRLQIFRTSDLKEVANGLLPYESRASWMSTAPTNTLFFSPDQKELVLQLPSTYWVNDKGWRHPAHDLLLKFVKTEADRNGTYPEARPEVKIPRCIDVTFLRKSDWPTITFWNDRLGAVESVNVSTRQIVDRLPLYYQYSPQLGNLNPKSLEKPDIGQVLEHALGGRGWVIPGDGQSAYYLPWPTQVSHIRPAPMQKVNLVGTLKVVATRAIAPDIRFCSRAAASDVTGVLGCVLAAGDKPGQEPNYGLEPGNKVRFYSTEDLRFLQEIELSLSTCDGLFSSVDGKQFYAVNGDQGKLVIIDTHTRKEMKSFDKIAKYPNVVIDLPSTQGGTN